MHARGAGDEESHARMAAREIFVADLKHLLALDVRRYGLPNHTGLHNVAGFGSILRTAQVFEVRELS
jgi:hypothetical protein